MKKVIVVFALFLIQSLLYAQSPIGKGSISLGGSISYSSQSYENLSFTESTFIFNPKAGYFFIDNFYTALSINYVHYKVGVMDSDEYGFGPAIRYYFDAGIIKPFLGLGFNYVKHSVSSQDGNYSTNEFITSGGVDLFIIPSLAFETTINYSFINYKFTESHVDPIKSNLFRIDIGLNYFIY